MLFDFQPFIFLILAMGCKSLLSRNLTNEGEHVWARDQSAPCLFLMSFFDFDFRFENTLGTAVWVFFISFQRKCGLSSSSSYCSGWRAHRCVHTRTHSSTVRSCHKEKTLHVRLPLPVVHVAVTLSTATKACGSVHTDAQQEEQKAQKK